MKILKFTLSGRNGFFKIPEVNTYYYFTYGNIHKVALLGMFGAILGYKGYNQENRKKSKKNKELEVSYPEFYDKLKELKVSIVPTNEKGFIPKKIQSFNNSVGYASKEQGGNLIIKEQWLDNPCWDICVMIDSEEGEKLATSIMQKKAVYIPYLGKNDHMADITNANIYDVSPVRLEKGLLNCLCTQDEAVFVELNRKEKAKLGYAITYKYKEKLPIGLDELTNYYIVKDFIYTNNPLEIFSDVYVIEDKNIVFY